MATRDRVSIARSAASGLRQFISELDDNPVLLGFDGFVDSIIDVVDKRHDKDRYERLTTIGELGRKITAAAGQSSNYELVVKLEKLGGNGPIMANAMAAFGLPVTYIGALGYPDVDPVFSELAQRSRVISVAGPGRTDALEFADGKLMLGKLQTLKDVNWARMEAVAGADELLNLFRQARLLGMVNWTMLPYLSNVWQHLVDSVLPSGSIRQAGDRFSSIWRTRKNAHAVTSSTR